MKYSIKTKLVMASVIPALLTTVVIIFLAIKDMFSQRDHIANASKEFLEKTPNPTPDVMHDFIMQQWQTIFDMQSAVSITGILIVAALLIIISLFLVNSISSGLNNLVKGVQTMSDPRSPLSYRIPTHDTNDMTPLANQLNEMMSRVENVIVRIKESSHSLQESAEILQSDAQSNQQNSESLHLNMDSVSTAMTELETASSEIANNVQAAHQEVNDVNQRGQLINGQIRELDDQFITLNEIASTSANDVNELSKQVEGIYSILQTIQGIAEQTNLLALNAAIEAARAGEQGRGFAVVADEVRNLAGKTQQSTEEIQSMIENLKQSADRSMKAMTHSSEATGSLSESFKQANEEVLSLFNRLELVNNMNAQIATASEEQTQVISDISQTMVSTQTLSDNTQQSSYSTGEQAAALMASANKLKEMVADFNFD